MHTRDYYFVSHYIEGHHYAEELVNLAFTLIIGLYLVKYYSLEIVSLILRRIFQLVAFGLLHLFPSQ